jgi:hypothetical protein
MPQAPGSLSGFSPFKNPRLPAVFGGILLRYVFANATELHLFLHELFRPDIHKLLQIAVEIHGPARIEEPRPGRSV